MGNKFRPDFKDPADKKAKDGTTKSLPTKKGPVNPQPRRPAKITPNKPSASLTPDKPKWTG